MKRLFVIIGLAVLLAQTTQAATLNATKVGQIFTTTPIAETAFQALTQFRGQFTPVNIAVTALNVLLITKIGDGINALRVQMASPLPAAYAPVGWADAETPTTTSNLIQNFATTSWGGNYPSAQLACNKACTANSAASSLCVVAGTTCTLYWPAGTVRASSAITQGADSCAAGYTLQSGSCNLTNAAATQWPSDGVGTVRPVNGVLTPNAHDPDNSGIVAGDISRTGTDSYNNPVKETVKANGQNGYDYLRDTQSINTTTGEPTVQRDQYSIDGSGQVTSVTSNTYNNSTVSSVNTTTQGQTDVSMLAKDATLSQTNTKLDDVKTLLAKDTAAYTDAPTTRTIADSLTLVFDKIKSKLPTVVFSDVEPDCPVFTKHIPFINVDLTIDQFCTMDDLIRPTLQAVSLFIYALMAFFIIMRA
jgi:hypothetical protein